jgi:hypothetical protein
VTTTGATGIGASVGSPDPADRERAMVAVNNEVVTARTAAIRTPAGLSSQYRPR